MMNGYNKRMILDCTFPEQGTPFGLLLTTSNIIDLLVYIPLHTFMFSLAEIADESIRHKAMNRVLNLDIGILKDLFKIDELGLLVLAVEISATCIRNREHIDAAITCEAEKVH